MKKRYLEIKQYKEKKPHFRFPSTSLKRRELKALAKGNTRYRKPAQVLLLALTCLRFGHPLAMPCVCFEHVQILDSSPPNLQVFASHSNVFATMETYEAINSREKRKINSRVIDCCVSFEYFFITMYRIKNTFLILSEAFRPKKCTRAAMFFSFFTERNLIKGCERVYNEFTTVLLAKKSPEVKFHPYRRQKENILNPWNNENA